VGTYQAELVHVELLNREEITPQHFAPGDMLRIRMHYWAHERVPTPAFGLAIYRSDGTHVNGPNSVMDGYSIPFIEGKGHVDYGGRPSSRSMPAAMN